MAEIAAVVGAAIAVAAAVVAITAVDGVAAATMVVDTMAADASLFIHNRVLYIDITLVAVICPSCIAHVHNHNLATPAINHAHDQILVTPAVATNHRAFFFDTRVGQGWPV